MIFGNKFEAETFSLESFWFPLVQQTNERNNLNVCRRKKNNFCRQDTRSLQWESHSGFDVLL